MSKNVDKKLKEDLNKNLVDFVEKLENKSVDVKQILVNGSNILPKENPINLEDCLLIFEQINYESYGFPAFFLDYTYTFRKWGISFRNPVNFSDPNIQENAPLLACHKMFDFLRTLPVKIKDEPIIRTFDNFEVAGKIVNNIVEDNKFTIVDNMG